MRKAISHTNFFNTISPMTTDLYISTYTYSNMPNIDTKKTEVLGKLARPKVVNYVDVFMVKFRFKPLILKRCMALD